MYQPPAVRRARYVTRQVAPLQTGADRFALAFALFSAFTFMGTLMMMCAVVGLAALLLRSETRWGQLAELLSSQSVAPGANLSAGPGSGTSPLPTPATEAPAVAPTGVADVPEQPPASEPLPDQPASDAAHAQPPVMPAPQQALQQQLPPQLPPQQAPEQQLSQQQSPLATPSAPALQQPATPTAASQLPNDPAQTPSLGPPPSDPGAVSNQVGVLIQYSNNLIDALEQLSDLSSDPLWGDGDWANLVQGQLSRVRQTYNELGGIPVSPELTAAHSTLLNAAAQCNSATYTVENALNSGDQSLLETSADQVSVCLDVAYSASSEVSNLLLGQP